MTANVATDSLRVVIAILFSSLCLTPHKLSAAPAAAPTTSSEEFQIGDRLRISISDLEIAGQDTTFTPLIDDDGKIGLPLIPPVTAAGRSVDDLQEIIRQAYSDAHLISGANVGVERIELSTAPKTPRGPLAAGSHLTVRIWDIARPGKESEFPRQIDSGGSVALPDLKGTIHIAGLSERDAAKKMTAEFKHQMVIANATVEVVCTSR